MQALKVLLMSILLAWIALPAHGVDQRSDPTIVGVVTDATGAPLVGAKVSVTNSLTKETRQTTTDAQGRYKLSNLTPGLLIVETTAAKFLPASREVRVGPGETVTVDFQLSLAPLTEAITVTASAKAELERVPGAIAEIPQREIEQSLAHNLKDVLAFTPGVLAQSRSGADESQISIRGSGLRSNFHLRGLNIMVNGMPYQDADGFSDFESLDLMATQRVEVWKGANALRYGGNSMGGAINFVTNTGETASPLQARVEGGSFGLFKGQMASGGVKGPFSYYLSFSDTKLDGYREHNKQGRQRVFGNMAWKLDSRTDLRVDMIYAHVSEKLPGSLTRTEFFNSPRRADPTNVQQDWGRFYDYVRLGVGLRRQLDDRQEVVVTVYGQYRDQDHPIFQVLDQQSRNFGGEVYYRRQGVLGGRRDRFVVGFSPQVGNTGERRFANIRGQRGNLTALFGTAARNYGLYFENQFDITSVFTLVTGGRADRAVRRFDDRFLPNRGRSDQRTYKAFSPKLGFVYRPTENIQVFGNASRSYEPPLLLELTSFGAPGFLNLKAQDTWQYEIGTRGRVSERVSWDVAFFDAEISNEIINVNVRPFPGAPFTIPSYRSAPNTRHMGIEWGMGVLLRQSLLSEDDRLTWRTAYTWSRFRFVNDRSFGNNFIPGAPRHILRAELRYEHTKGLWVAPNIDWSPATYFMDSANTARNDKYAVLNLKAGYDWKKVGFYVEAANLTNRLYSASVQVDNAVGRYFEPANGRSAYVGIRFQF